MLSCSEEMQPLDLDSGFSRLHPPAAATVLRRVCVCEGGLKTDSLGQVDILQTAVQNEMIAGGRHQNRTGSAGC